MVRLASILSFGLVGGLAAAAPAEAQCGKVNIMFTGLPHNHPLVISQGWDPVFVNTNLRADAQRILKAGYNLRVAFLGPEQKITALGKEMDGIDWHGAGVGFGIRGANLPELTVRLEDILKTYREKAPKAEQWFNYSPNSTLWALNRHFPLPKDCPPGKDLGYKEICEICTASQKVKTAVTAIVTIIHGQVMYLVSQTPNWLKAIDEFRSWMQSQKGRLASLEL